MNGLTLVYIGFTVLSVVCVIYGIAVGVEIHRSGVTRSRRRGE